jgi:hypothetical protein
MWCAEVIFNAHHRQEKYKREKFENKRKKENILAGAVCCPM